jgi:hypothetical protein
MPRYQILLFAPGGRLSRREEVECLIDHYACERTAEMMDDHVAAEVWDGDRPVARIGNPRMRQESLDGVGGK